MKLLRTLAVAYLYYPHLWLMRLLGPYGAVALARLTAYAQWLATFVGASKSTLAVMRATQSQWTTRESARTVMRRYLQNKHQSYAEWCLYPSRRGRRYVEQRYSAPVGREYLDAALAENRGAILLISHFGLIKMAFPALQAYGYDVCQHLARVQTYSDATYDWMAQAAHRRMLRIDETSGLKMLYHRPLTTLITLARILRQGGLVGITADGMQGDDFIETPFLGGVIRLPAGPAAQLAAQTAAPLLPMFVLPEGLYGHRFVIHEPIYATGTSHQAIEATVQQFGAVLETYVREYPWAWWTWRRLEFQRASDGTVRFDVRSHAVTLASS